MRFTSLFRARKNKLSFAVIFTSTWLLLMPSTSTGAEEKDCKLEALINNTQSEDDNFVVVSDKSLGSKRPFTPLTLTFKGTSATFKVKLRKSQRLSFSEPERFTLKKNKPVEIRLFGDVASTKELDEQVIIEGPTSNVVCIKLPPMRLTVITGIKVAFAGTFLFVTENNMKAEEFPNGEFAQCATDTVWRITPLNCEGLGDAHDKLIFEEGKAKDRFALSTGKRPKIEVTISEVRTFGPEVKLGNRDPLLKPGTPIQSLEASKGTIAVLLPGGCAIDDVPFEFEQVINFRIRFGNTFGLQYADTDPPTVSHVWRFNIFNTNLLSKSKLNSLRKSDLKLIPNFFPGGQALCSESSLSYLKNDSQTMAGETPVCDKPLSVKQLFTNNAGEVGAFRLDWANWTSRSQVLKKLPDFKDSFIARLFDDSIRALKKNGNANAKDDIRAEVFMQLAEYDWYTLTGNVEKGVASTPGGIFDKVNFPEFLVQGETGCPATTPSAEHRKVNPYFLAP